MLPLHHAYLSNDLSKFTQLLESCKGSKRISGKLRQTIDVNQTDDCGRTALHLAATDGKWQFIEALLKVPQIDLSKTDLESNWTALHRALYFGHVSSAREIIKHYAVRSASFRELLTIPDFDSNLAFDVFNSTIRGVNPDAHDSALGCSDLFTFGSNANHTLGFSDSDDRAYPERVNVPHQYGVDYTQNNSTKFVNPAIKDVSLSKFHTLVITNEPGSNLYACGFSNDGRLGMPGGTRFKLEAIAINEQIAAIATAQDHSLVVSAKGTLYSWGSQSHAQLGYDLEDQQFEVLPRKVPKLSREVVLGVAASAIHSVCFTAASVFTWGYNAGQLGYEVAGGLGSIVITPRKVTAINSTVVQVTATRFATICLTGEHDVIIFINSTYFKLHMQLDRFASQLTMSRPRKAVQTTEVIKVTSGITKIALLTNTGEVYGLVLDEATANVKPSSLSKQIRPHRIWSSQKKHLAVRDVALGQETTIILCTVGGIVFTGSQRSVKSRVESGKLDYKFSRLPSITRIVQVRASEHGAFVVFRSDVLLPPIVLDANRLNDDLSKLLPYATAEREQPVEKMTKGNNEDVEEQSEGIMSYLDKRIMELVRCSDHQSLCKTDPSHDLVITVAGKTISAHRCVVLCRSPAFSRLLTSASDLEGMYLKTGKISSLELSAPHDNPMAICVILHWMYTDTILTPWLSCPAPYQYDMNNLRIAVRKLAVCLGLLQLAKAIASNYTVKSFTSLSEDISALNVISRHSNTRDTCLILQDGQIMTNSVILSARSGFFSAIFTGSWLSDRRAIDTTSKMVDIDLKHISSKTMALVLDHIFCDRDTIVFNGDEPSDVEEFLDSIISVLAAATEFMLPRLAQVCQQLLCKHVHRKNVSLILHLADLYSASELKTACLEYCSMNMQILLENRLLDDLDMDLMHEIELHVTKLQMDRSPTSRSGVLLSEVMQRNPELLDFVKKEKERYVSSLLSLPAHKPSLTSHVRSFRTPNRKKSAVSPLPSDSQYNADDSLIFPMEELNGGSASAPKQITSADAMLSTPDSTRNRNYDSMSKSKDRKLDLRANAASCESSTNFEHALLTQTSPRRLRSKSEKFSENSTDLHQQVVDTNRSKHGSTKEEDERCKVPTARATSESSASPWATVINKVSLLEIIASTPRHVSNQAKQASSSAMPRSPTILPAMPNRKSFGTPVEDSTLASDAHKRKVVSTGSLSPASATFKKSLSEIIAAEEEQKSRVAAFKAKRSMKEIQEAEAEAKRAADFEKWFEKESVRVQEEEQKIKTSTGVHSKKSRKPQKVKQNQGSLPKIPGQRLEMQTQNDGDGSSARSGNKRTAGISSHAAEETEPVLTMHNLRAMAPTFRPLKRE